MHSRKLLPCPDLTVMYVACLRSILIRWLRETPAPTTIPGSSPSLTYVGCFQDHAERGLKVRLGHLDLEGCAEAASAAGYTIFALQCPQCADGTTAECWVGSGEQLGTGLYTLKPDSECKGEAWNPSAYGDTFTYNGAGHRNAVYTFSPSPTTGTPAPTTPALTGTPAPTTIPGSSPSLTYVGCFKDQGERCLEVHLGHRDLEGCAEAASAAGYTIFSLQCPWCADEPHTRIAMAHCFAGSGVLFGTGTCTPLPDSECKGSPWNPVAYGDTFYYNGGGWINAVYTFSSAPPPPAPTTIPGLSPSLTYVGCFEDHPERGLKVELGGLDLEGCAEAASALGYTTFALQCPPCAVSVGTAQCYAGSGVQLGTGAYTLKPDSECKGDTWNPSAYGDTFTYNGNHWRNAVYTFSPSPTTATPGPPPAPTTIPGPSPSLTYVGCFQDVVSWIEDEARWSLAFPVRLEFLDLQGCAEAASAAGYTIFALQCPDCADGMMAVCFTGSGALLGTDQFPLKPDSECKGETWNPSAYGDTYTYNGDSFRNAVYTFSSAPPPPAPTIPGPSPSLTYVGCFQDDGSWDLPVNLEFLDLEVCAEAASAAGHTIFALQCPECGESVGTTAYCFTGYGEHLSTGVRFRVPDSECKGETWNPSAYGDTFTYNGKASRNAVYTFSSAVYTLAPSPTTPASTGTPAPTTPAPTTSAPTTIPGSSPSLTYVGCFADHPERGLKVLLEASNLEGCAEAASAAGYTIFALQCPQCAEGTTAPCFIGSGVLLGTGVYTLKPDSECKGETWNPSAYGDTFTYNGNHWRNAVYTFNTKHTNPRFQHRKV